MPTRQFIDAIIRIDSPLAPDNGAGPAQNQSCWSIALIDFEALTKQRPLLHDLGHSGLGAPAYCPEHELGYGRYKVLVRYERLRQELNNVSLFYAPSDCTYEVSQQLMELDFGDLFAPLQGSVDAVRFDELQHLDEAAIRVLRT